MKITKLNSLTFQRNGVRGESFYATSFNFSDSPFKGKNFIATFKTIIAEDGDAELDEIDISSCRVVDPANVSEAWRGDEFAYALHDYFKAKKRENPKLQIYDLTTNEAEYQKLISVKLPKDAPEIDLEKFEKTVDQHSPQNYQP